MTQGFPPRQQQLSAHGQFVHSSPPPIKPNLVSHPLKPLGEVVAHKVLAVVQVGRPGPGVATAAVPLAPKLLVIPHDSSGVPVHAPCSTSPLASAPGSPRAASLCTLQHRLLLAAASCKGAGSPQGNHSEQLHMGLGQDGTRHLWECVQQHQLLLGASTDPSDSAHQPQERLRHCEMSGG